MSIKQHKLGTYLAVSAGAGCAASVANGAIQVIDLSGFSTTPGSTFSIPGASGGPASDGLFDFGLSSSTDYGQLTLNTGSSYFFVDDYYSADFYGTGPNGYYYAEAFTSGPQAFPTNISDIARWHDAGLNLTGGDFVIGENWLPFCDTELRFGWLSFTLNSLGTNSTSPVASFNYFVYDDVSTQATNAIPLETAIGAIPEPSSLALLALGSVGLATRRQRRKTA